MNETRNNAMDNTMDHELQGRLALMESMIAEGRKTTEYWGWAFVLWGIAYFVAIGWSYLSGRGDIAWPVTMIGGVVLTTMIARAKKTGRACTTTSRAISSIWTAVGLAFFAYCFPLSASGHAEPHAFQATVEVLLGVANLASGLLLRWRQQRVIGLLWMSAAVATCFVSRSAIVIIFMVATLVCLVGFGVYLMIRESRDKARAGQVVHA